MSTLLDRLTVRVAALAAMLVSLAFVTGCLGDPWPPPATPVVAAGRVYAEGEGAVVAIDARTGAVIRRVAGSDFAAVDRFLYVGGRELQAVDVADGSVVWRLPPRPGAFYQKVAADAARVYFHVRVLGHAEPFVEPDSPLVAVHRATGRQLWSAVTPRSTEVMVADGVVLTDQGGLVTAKIVARDAATGAARWTVAYPRKSRPLVARGRVLLPAEGDVREVDASTGRETWRGPAADDWGSTVEADTLYRTTGRDVEAINLASKRARWKQPCAGRMGAGDGLVVCATTTAIARRADTGEVAWQIALPAAPLDPPVIADGVVVFCTDYTEIVAVDAGTGKARWKVDLAKSTRRPGS